MVTKYIYVSPQSIWQSLDFLLWCLLIDEQVTDANNVHLEQSKLPNIRLNQDADSS